MIIRNAQAGDSADIVELLAQLGYPGTADFVPEKIERLLGHCDAELLVAEDGGRLLGFIGLHFMVQLALPGTSAASPISASATRPAAAAWGGPWKRRPKRWRAPVAATASRCIATSAASTRTASTIARATRNRPST